MLTVGCAHESPERSPILEDDQSTVVWDDESPSSNEMEKEGLVEDALHILGLRICSAASENSLSELQQIFLHMFSMADDRGRTALNIAASKGHHEVAKFLIEHGADDHDDGLHEDEEIPPFEEQNGYHAVVEETLRVQKKLKTRNANKVHLFGRTPYKRLVVQKTSVGRVKVTQPRLRRHKS